MSMAECTCSFDSRKVSYAAMIDVWHFVRSSRIIPRGGEPDVRRIDRVKRIVVDRLGVDESEVTLEASFKEDLRC